MKLLVVEDEDRIRESIKKGLELEGYAVDTAMDGEDGYASASADEYDAIILDVMMPGMNGFEVAKKLREDDNHTPILMLTAKSQAKDIVEGLDTGADDYLPKPFDFDVLTARVRALLRRPTVTNGTVLTAADLSLDTVTKRVERAGKELALSQKEYAILEYLLANKNRVVSKNSIISHVWDFDADVLPNNVEVFINYLRAKIDKPFPGGRPLIETVRGFGYTIKDDL